MVCYLCTSKDGKKGWTIDLGVAKGFYEKKIYFLICRICDLYIQLKKAKHKLENLNYFNAFKMSSYLGPVAPGLCFYALFWGYFDSN